MSYRQFPECPFTVLNPNASQLEKDFDGGRVTILGFIAEPERLMLLTHPTEAPRQILAWALADGNYRWPWTREKGVEVIASPTVRYPDGKVGKNGARIWGSDREWACAYIANHGLRKKTDDHSDPETEGVR